MGPTGPQSGQKWVREAPARVQTHASRRVSKVGAHYFLEFPSKKIRHRLILEKTQPIGHRILPTSPLKYPKFQKPLNPTKTHSTTPRDPSRTTRLDELVWLEHIGSSISYQKNSSSTIFLKNPADWPSDFVNMPLPSRSPGRDTLGRASLSSITPSHPHVMGLPN